MPAGPALAALLAGCGGTPPPPTTVTGLQVVAIVTDPPQPTALQDLTVEVWVADGLGLGADVVLWMCAPVDGRCVEFDALPGSDGLPLQFVTRTGAAAPVFRATVAWPLLASIASDYVSTSGAFDPELTHGAPDGFLIWALACVPGLCDVVREVRADPVAASPTWWDATDALSDPALILEGVEPGEASVAVKFVPTWPTLDATATFYAPNLAPELSMTALSPVVHQGTWFDPDGDDVQLIAFTTAGTARLERPLQGALQVTTSPTTRDLRALARDPEWSGGDLFVVADDGRGGTAIWTNVAEQTACAPEVRFAATGEPGSPLLVGGGDVIVTVQVRGVPLPAVVSASLDSRNGRWSWFDTTTVTPPYAYTGYGGYLPAPADPCAWSTAYLSLSPAGGAVEPCSFGGTPVTLTATVSDETGVLASAEEVHVAQAPSYLGCP